MIGANAPAGSDDRIGRITTVPSLSSLGSFAGSERYDQLSRTVTPELQKRVTMGRSHDQTGSDPSHDPVPNPASKESCDKE